MGRERREKSEKSERGEREKREVEHECGKNKPYSMVLALIDKSLFSVDFIRSVALIKNFLIYGSSYHLDLT